MHDNTADIVVYATDRMAAPLLLLLLLR